MNKDVIQQARLLFGQTFKLLRKEKNLTQEEVAIFCGVTSKIIKKIEQGKLAFSIDFLLKLSVVLEYNIYLEEKENSSQSCFLLQKSEKSGYYTLTDTTNQIVCLFEGGNFNNTQKFTFLDNREFTNLPTIMKEFGDWLHNNHRDIL